jgi:hypothetical protein
MLMTQMLLKCWKMGVAGGKSGFDERLGVHRDPIIPQTARASDSTDRPMTPRRCGTFFILLFIQLIGQLTGQIN